jgi:FKBP-type peptidyl-prolyl cis-trans isomerase FkpA
MKFLYSILTSIFFGLISCESESEKVHFIDTLSKEERQEIMQESIKNAVNKEQLQIQGWINRYGKKFTETSTGVHIHEIQQGDSSKTIQNEDVLTVQYTLTLLNGDTITPSTILPSTIKVNKDNKESGLHEALTKLHKNTEAIVIIPSYRAHGLMGDNDKIPFLTTIIYQIKIIDVAQ